MRFRNIAFTFSLVLTALACPAFADCSQLSAKLQDGQVAHAQDVVNYFNACANFTGPVGIGVSTLNGRLTVVGGGELVGLYPATGSNGYIAVDQASNHGTRWRLGHTGAVPGFSSFDIYNETAGTLAFTVNAANQIGIGTAAPAYTLDVNGIINTSALGGFALGSVAGRARIQYGTSGATSFSLLTNTDSYAGLYANTGNFAGSVTASNFVPTSDRRLKTDIRPLSTDALIQITALRPVTFRWKSPKDDGMQGQQIGFIAQDVEKVLPTTVVTAHDSLKTKAIKYNEITALLTKALQEEHALVEKQARQIAALQQSNRELVTRVSKLEKPRLASAK